MATSTYIVGVLHDPRTRTLVARLSIDGTRTLPNIIRIVARLGYPSVCCAPNNRDTPRPSPLSHHVFNGGVHRINSHITTIITRDRRVTLRTLGLVSIRCRILGPMVSVSRTVTRSTPIIRSRPIICITNIPSALRSSGDRTTRHNRRVVVGFPVNSHPHGGVTTDVRNRVNSVSGNFTSTSIVVRQACGSARTRRYPARARVYFAQVSNSHLIVRTSARMP